MSLPAYYVEAPHSRDWYAEDDESDAKELESSSNIQILARQIYQHEPFEKNWRSPVEEELEEVFHKLRDDWKRETMFLSSVTEIILNENYQSIIGLGPDVLPLLLKDLAETRSLWFPALAAISRENPVRREHAGNIKKMVEDWLDWGHRKGYL